MSKRFDGKHVLVTGGARGIGFEIAQHFGREGARLSIFDREQAWLEETAHRFRKEGYEVHPFPVDVAQSSQVFEAVERAENDAPIEVLVNNAGVAYETPFLTMEESEWREVLDINLTGIFLVALVLSVVYFRREGAAVAGRAVRT